MDILSLKTRRLKYLFRNELDQLTMEIEDGDINIFEACNVIRAQFEHLGFDPSITDPLLDKFENLTPEDDITQFVEFFTCLNIILKLPILNKQQEILNSFFYDILRQEDLDNLESFKILARSIHNAGFNVDPDKSIKIRLTPFTRIGGKRRKTRKTKK